MPKAADTTERKDEAIQLHERYEYFKLLDALDGKVNFTLDVEAAAALSMTDVDALRKLVQAREREGNFIEANEAIANKTFKDDSDAKIKAGTGKTANEKRQEFLTKLKRTRLYARAAYDKLAEKEGFTPFD